jgi:hypothetical protein
MPDNRFVKSLIGKKPLDSVAQGKWLLAIKAISEADVASADEFSQLIVEHQANLYKHESNKNLDVTEMDSQDISLEALKNHALFQLRLHNTEHDVDEYINSIPEDFSDITNKDDAGQKLKGVIDEKDRIMKLIQTLELIVATEQQSTQMTTAYQSALDTMESINPRIIALAKDVEIRFSEPSTEIPLEPLPNFTYESQGSSFGFETKEVDQDKLQSYLQALAKGEPVEGGTELSQAVIKGKESIFRNIHLPENKVIVSHKEFPSTSSKYAILKQSNTGKVTSHTSQNLTSQEKAETAIKQVSMLIANYDPNKGKIILRGHDKDMGRRFYAALLYAARQPDAEFTKDDIDIQIPGMSKSGFSAWAPLTHRAKSQEDVFINRHLLDSMDDNPVPESFKKQLSGMFGRVLKTELTESPSASRTSNNARLASDNFKDKLKTFREANEGGDEATIKKADKELREDFKPGG